MLPLCEGVVRVRVDKTSWHSRGVLRRDFRHTHAEPETPKPRKARDGKKCKHTCFGKPELLHQWEFERPPWWSRFASIEEAIRDESALPMFLRFITARCTRCGRKTYVNW